MKVLGLVVQFIVKNDNDNDDYDDDDDDDDDDDNDKFSIIDSKIWSKEHQRSLT